jgi:hypothetical protein
MKPAGLPLMLGALLTRGGAAAAQTVARAKRLGNRFSTRLRMTRTNDPLVLEKRY